MYGFLRLGMDPHVFTSLCLFTYLILREQQYDTFNVLVNQFKTLTSKDKYLLEKWELINFFEKCHRYFNDILAKRSDELKIVKIILCMIGLLPINKTNFAQHNYSSYNFSKRILTHVRCKFSELYQSVDDTEFILFERGLTTLLCIELLRNSPDDYTTDKFSFLQEISNEKQRQDLACKLLSKLYRLEHIIIGDTNWTDLFLMVSPKQIVINHLELTNSFQTFYICISKISRVLSHAHVFRNQINDFFENQVSKDRLQGKVPK